MALQAPTLELLSLAMLMQHRQRVRVDVERPQSLRGLRRTKLHHTALPTPLLKGAGHWDSELDQLAGGRLFAFADWPVPDVPNERGGVQDLAVR